jgi:hypothetical protein
MKKFTFLFAMTMICAIAFGQATQKTVKMRKDASAFSQKGVDNYAELTKTAIWSNDFSNAADWTLGNDPAGDGAAWIICTEATAPTDWLPVYGMGTDPFASPTASNGFALFQSDKQGSTADALLQDAWIQIANPIDLSAVVAPRFVFSTLYRQYDDVTYFEYSIDGGTVWTQHTLFTTLDPGTLSTNPFNYTLTIPDLGGEANVLFRFRYTGNWDYGLFIDDISIVEAPNYDLSLLSSSINFFEAIDYSVAGQEQYYHYSSHYGIIPDEVLQNTNAPIFFNAIISNNGLINATPSVKVTIKDPLDVEIYSFTKVAEAVFPAVFPEGSIDTLDIAYIVGEEFYVTPELFKLGNYTVTFEAFIEGQVDGNPENNTFTTNFVANDNIYARDGGNLNSACGPSQWSSSIGDGDMFGVSYLFLADTQIDSVQAFITASSDASTSLICHIMQFDEVSTTWIDISTSALVTINAEDLGTWKTFTFTDVPFITLGADETSKSIKVALEFYYNGTSNDLYVGEDNTLPSSPWGTSWKFVGDTEWTVITNYYKSAPMIRACLPFTMGSVSDISTSDISMYPNPTTGLFVISNVEGASIEVINLMGQVVSRVDNANETNTIDLSNNANGTYIVKIIKNNEVTTGRLNVIK